MLILLTEFDLVQRYPCQEDIHALLQLRCFNTPNEQVILMMVRTLKHGQSDLLNAMQRGAIIVGYSIELIRDTCEANRLRVYEAGALSIDDVLAFMLIDDVVLHPFPLSFITKYLADQMIFQTMVRTQLELFNCFDTCVQLQWDHYRQWLLPVTTKVFKACNGK